MSKKIKKKNLFKACRKFGAHLWALTFNNSHYGMASKMRRDCELTAVNIAMWYPYEAGANAMWVSGIVERAYQVSNEYTSTHIDKKTPHDVLIELANRIHDNGFKLPFGTPEEMIPGYDKMHERRMK